MEYSKITKKPFAVCIALQLPNGEILGLRKSTSLPLFSFIIPVTSNSLNSLFCPSVTMCGLYVQKACFIINMMGFMGKKENVRNERKAL